MPPKFHAPDSSVLKDKVVVLTGGAAGIGAATVRLLHTSGAHVFFGDIQDIAGQKLEAELSSSSTTCSSPSSSTIKFLHCDVTSYADNLTLFNTAFSAFGRIDHALANAGIIEQGNIFDPNLTLETVQDEPHRSLRVLDVNLKGPIYFARIASVYLRQGTRSQQEGKTDKTLTFTSSVGGFREDPGLWLYCPSKHGVLGLMRVLREPFSQPPFSIRTNAICPWATFTELFAGIEESWQRAGLPANRPEDVAKVLVGILADPGQQGGALYIEGGRAWDVEKGLLETRSLWLGERQAADLDRGTVVLGGGEEWIKNQ